MNVLHSSMEITDQFYSNLNEREIKMRIDRLRDSRQDDDAEEEELEHYREFLAWQKQRRGK